MLKRTQGFILAFLTTLLAIACRDDEVAGPRVGPLPPASFVFSPGAGNECVFSQVRTFDETGFAQGVDATTLCNTFGSIHPATPIYFNPDVSIAWISADPDDLMPAQPGPVTFTFERPILNPVVVTNGNMACSGDLGRVIARTVSNATLTAAFEIANPPDCGEDNQTNSYISPAIMTTASDPIASVEVTPPSTMEWFFSYDITICDPMCHPAHFEGTPRAHIGYSVYFREPPVGNPTVTINAGGSFIAEGSERELTFSAVTNPSDAGQDMTWEVVDDPNDVVPSIPPTEITPPSGPNVVATVPDQNAGRWSTITHDDTELEKKSLSFLVTGILHTAQGEVRSTERTVRQDEMDTMREEYVELKSRRIPARSEIESRPSVEFGLNTGDYSVAVVNHGFETTLEQLHTVWQPRPWQINTIFRSPVHNLRHLKQGEDSDPDSWHQFGCAADLQTFPGKPDRFTEPGRTHARAFWLELAFTALFMGFDVEPMVASTGRRGSGVGHVHVELDCP
jgi:hypothetical protein